MKYYTSFEFSTGRRSFEQKFRQKVFKEKSWAIKETEARSSGQEVSWYFVVRTPDGASSLRNFVPSSKFLLFSFHWKFFPLPVALTDQPTWNWPVQPVEEWRGKRWLWDDVQKAEEVVVVVSGVAMKKKSGGRWTGMGSCVRRAVAGMKKLRRRNKKQKRSGDGMSTLDPKEGGTSRKNKGESGARIIPYVTWKKEERERERWKRDRWRGEKMRFVNEWVRSSKLLTRAEILLLVLKSAWPIHGIQSDLSSSPKSSKVSLAKPVSLNSWFCSISTLLLPSSQDHSPRHQHPAWERGKKGGS